MKENVTNSSELAAALGVSRQVVAYHQTRSGAPKTLSVQAWRDYLLSVGKSGTVEKLDRQAHTSFYEAMSVSGKTVLETVFLQLSESLPGAVGKALAACGASLTPQQSDALVWCLWNEQAEVAQRFVDEWNMYRFGDLDGSGPFNPIEGEADYDLPDEIESIRKRLKAKKRPPASAA